MPSRSLLLGLALVLASADAQAGSAEHVEFGSSDSRLAGELFRPDGAGPFPAVVALHGCGGLYGKDGKLSPRHADWAERLRGAGFTVLLPDSFGPRGLGGQCRAKNREVRASRERIGDALAAKAYLQSRPDVKQDAVSLLGWSNGGSTVLYALRQGRNAGETAPDFARAIAFYPGCAAPLARGGWHTRVPLLILIGEADDWTPAEPCKQLAAAAQKAGEPVEIATFAGAYHSFDAPGLALKQHRGLAYTASGTGVAHSGTNEAARTASIARAMAFLKR